MSGERTGLATQLTGYEIRPVGSVYAVFMTRVDGEQVPVDRQHVIFQRESRDHAQKVCDVLNNGILSRVVAAAGNERRVRADNKESR